MDELDDWKNGAIAFEKKAIGHIKKLKQENMGLLKDIDILVHEKWKLVDANYKLNQRISDTTLGAALKLNCLEDSCKKLASVLVTLSNDLIVRGNARVLCEKYIPNALKDIDGLQKLAESALEDYKKTAGCN